MALLKIDRVSGPTTIINLDDISSFTASETGGCSINLRSGGDPIEIPDSLSDIILRLKQAGIDILL